MSGHQGVSLRCARGSIPITTISSQWVSGVMISWSKVTAWSVRAWIVCMDALFISVEVFLLYILIVRGSRTEHWSWDRRGILIVQFISTIYCTRSGYHLLGRPISQLRAWFLRSKAEGCISNMSNDQTLKSDPFHSWFNGNSCVRTFVQIVSAVSVNYVLY